MTERRQTLATLALLAATTLALSLFLGSRGLNEPDEGRYAEIGREMLATGDWLIPHLNGVPHFQKPPLLYWATAASFGLGGANEWAARIPSALAALGVVLLTLRIGRRLRDFRTGLAAALILLSAIEFFALARLLTPDMPLTFWITAAIAALVEHWATRRAVWRWLFFLAMGLGFLTKGPMALVVPLAAALAVGRKEPRFSGWQWTAGMALTLAVGLSWFGAVSLRHHELFRYFLGYELLERFASRAHGRSRPFWFFGPVLLGGFLPWTLFLPPVIGRAWRRWRSEEPLTWPQRLLAGWAIMPFVVLSISGSKLPTYILPLFPALALGLAFWWLGDGQDSSRRAGLGLAMALFALLPVAVLALPHLLSAENAPHFSRGFLVLFGGVTLVGILALLGGLIQPRGLSTLALLSGFSLTIWILLISQVGAVNRLLAQQASVRPLAEAFLKANPARRPPLFICNARAHGFEFYTRRLVGTTESEAAVVLDPSPDVASRLFSSKKECERHFGALPEAWGLIRSGDYGETFALERWMVHARSGDFLFIRHRRGLVKAAR